VIKKYEKLVEELERELDENEERMSESEEKENEERQSKYSSEEKAAFAIKVEKQPKRVKKKHDDFSSIFDMSKYDDENMLYELEIK